MNIRRLLRKAEGPQPLCRVVSRANLGYWHPSTTDIILSGVTDSHPLTTHFTPINQTPPMTRTSLFFSSYKGVPRVSKSQFKTVGYLRVWGGVRHLALPSERFEVLERGSLRQKRHSRVPRTNRGWT